MNNRYLVALIVVIAGGLLGLFVAQRFMQAPPLVVAPIEIIEVARAEPAEPVGPAQNLDELITQSEKPVVIDFNATWCGPCRMMKPIFKELEEELSDEYLFVDADVDEQKELATQYHVTAMPTFVFVKDGVEVKRVLGAKTKEELKEIIEQAF